MECGEDTDLDRLLRRTAGATFTSLELVEQGKSFCKTASAQRLMAHNGWSAGTLALGLMTVRKFGWA
jgi:hypothetical protein